METLRSFYESDKDFRRYVDAYCANYECANKLTVEQALEHVIVKNYAKYLQELNNGRQAV